MIVQVVQFEATVLRRVLHQSERRKPYDVDLGILRMEYLAQFLAHATVRTGYHVDFAL
jgi:hypothetical protein